MSDDVQTTDGQDVINLGRQVFGGNASLGFTGIPADVARPDQEQAPSRRSAGGCGCRNPGSANYTNWPCRSCARARDAAAATTRTRT
jgi:hypothetical protein